MVVARFDQDGGAEAAESGRLFRETGFIRVQRSGQTLALCVLQALNQGLPVG